eukprot:TRINITY_DN67921_c6_g5_i2.p1 TRINITY_DN67921_c6_g5~~TRINITY_DN67921_c6_g5_i2.p1  ORF type:complete len:244 (+),score=29.69 TRINITY_DN67921_c6_g5_i2:78-809(+)
MNPIIGWTGVLSRYGSTSCGSEPDKIQAHLEYAVQNLEARNDAISATTTEAQQKNRKVMLDLVSNYAKARQFPQHCDPSASEERRPCFIDAANRPCAVAHLMQMTGHSALATSINERFQHSYLSDIVAANPPKLSEWQHESGLSAEELAMIQPTYQFVADRCKAQFTAIMATLTTMADQQTPNASDLDAAVSNFCSSLLGGFGWPKRDFPMYQTKLKEFQQANPVLPEAVQEAVAKMLNATAP